MYSARFGNICTAEQLLQLMKRASGEFTPRDDCWVGPKRTIVDPFRPTVQKGGFDSIDAMRKDREVHFECVNRMFKNLDVFVFTLGLTEAWRARTDKAVYPVCPGVAGGEYGSSLSNLQITRL